MEDGIIGYGGQWPAKNVLGQPYTRPATTQGVGDGYFVVLPVGRYPAEVVTAVKAEVAGWKAQAQAFGPVEKLDEGDEQPPDVADVKSSKRSKKEADSAEEA